MRGGSGAAVPASTSGGANAKGMFISKYIQILRNLSFEFLPLPIVPPTVVNVIKTYLSSL